MKIQTKKSQHKVKDSIDETDESVSEESEDEVNKGDEDNAVNNVVQQLNRLSLAEDLNFSYGNSTQEKLITTVRQKSVFNFLTLKSYIPVLFDMGLLC